MGHLTAKPPWSTMALSPHRSHPGPQHREGTTPWLPPGILRHRGQDGTASPRAGSELRGKAAHAISKLIIER